MTALRLMTGKNFRTAFGGLIAALAFAFAIPAAAQTQDAPVDVTAAPPQSTETVGPSQLRDFNLQGTVTRQSDRPATTSTTPAQPATTSAAPPAASEGRSTASAQPERPSARPSSTPQHNAPAVSAGNSPAASVATPSTPLDVTTEAAPAPGFSQAPESVAAAVPATGESLPWPWIAAVLALLAGGAFIAWSRRGRRNRYGDPGRMAFAGAAPDVTTGPAPVAQPRPQPRPDPVPQRTQPALSPRPTPAPQPKKGDGLIVSTGLKPELNIQFQPDRAVVTENEVLVQFDVQLVNSGSAAARDVLIEAILVCAHAGQDQQIGNFFRTPAGQGDRIAAIPPLGRISLKSAVRLPLAQLHCFEAAGRKLFVPLVAFNILFRTNAGDDQASASFLVGRGSEEDEKLAPFRLDLGPRIFRGLSARPHSLGLKQVA